MEAHSSPKAARLFLAMAVCCTVQRSVPAQDMTKDLSHGATFKFKIAKSLPEFTFKVVPELNPGDTVKRIDVYRGDSDKVFQQLEGCEFANMEALPNGSDWFRAEDFNFDGYKDVFLMTWWGATGNYGGCIWLYHPGSGRFEYSKELSELPWRRLDPATKTILTFENGGGAGSAYDANRYRVEDNRPVLIWHEHQDWDDDKKQFHCTAEERRDEKMVSTKDLWSKPASDWSKVEAPCDPGKFFQ